MSVFFCFAGRRPGCVRRRNLDKNAAKRGRRGRKRLGTQRSRKKHKTKKYRERKENARQRGSPKRALRKHRFPRCFGQLERLLTCRSQHTEKQEKPQIPRVEGLRVGGQGPPMSALRGAGLGVFVVVIWTKRLRKGVASAWGHKEAEKNIKTRNTERGRKMLAKGAPRNAPSENTVFLGVSGSSSDF